MTTGMPSEATAALALVRADVTEGLPMTLTQIVLALLSRHPGMTRKQIQDAIGHKDISGTLSYLDNQGHIAQGPKVQEGNRAVYTWYLPRDVPQEPVPWDQRTTEELRERLATIRKARMRRSPRWELEEV